ncbi:Hypothetical protein D9617_2g058940 [Elsinoe fawcettii]|nr:Hypothetical protein D9617_2g058940 [Elsinoe fawcettii]
MPPETHEPAGMPSERQIDLPLRPAHLSAAQRALSLPEVVSALFQYIYAGFYYSIRITEDEYGHFDEYDLLFQCSLVNKLWYKEATRLIWKEPRQMTWNRGPAEILAPIPADRRQYYANFIEEVEIFVPCESEAAEEKDTSPLHKVVFPRLKRMRVYLDWDAQLPRLDCPNLQELNLDPRHEFYPEMWCITQPDTDRILDQVATLYPKLPTLSFWDECIAHPGTLQKFKERMGSGLTICDEHNVIESNNPRYGWS